MTFCVMTLLYGGVVFVLSMVDRGEDEKSLLGTKADDVFNLAYLPILCTLSLVSTLRLGFAGVRGRWELSTASAYWFIVLYVVGVVCACVRMCLRMLSKIASGAANVRDAATSGFVPFHNALSIPCLWHVCHLQAKNAMRTVTAMVSLFLDYCATITAPCVARPVHSTWPLWC